MSVQSGSICSPEWQHLRQKDSLFGFLQDKTKYVTFSSNAPVTMSWTITVSDSNTFTTSVGVSTHSNSKTTRISDLTIEFIKAHSDSEDDDVSSFQLGIGKSSDSSHTFERTVTITLDDDDIGTLMPRFITCRNILV